MVAAYLGDLARKVPIALATSSPFSSRASPSQKIVVCPAFITRPSARSKPVAVPMNWVETFLVALADTNGLRTLLPGHQVDDLRVKGKLLCEVAKKRRFLCEKRGLLCAQGACGGQGMTGAAAGVRHEAGFQ